MEAYSMAMCGRRAQGHLRSCSRGPTTSPVRVRTELRSIGGAGRPSETGVDWLAQYSRRIISVVLWVQLCCGCGGGGGGGGGGAVDIGIGVDPEADVDDDIAGLSTGLNSSTHCQLRHAAQSDELGGIAPRLPKLSNGYQVWEACSGAERGQLMAEAPSPRPSIMSMSMSIWSTPMPMPSIPSRPSRPHPVRPMLVSSGSQKRGGRRGGTWSDKGAASRFRGGFPAFRETPYTQVTPWATQRPQVG